jgi:ABC-2 type transport system permease protein
MLRLIVQDFRQLLRERLALAVLVIGLVAAAVASLSGAQWINQLSETRTTFLETHRADEAEYRARFASAKWTDVDSADAPYTSMRTFAFPIPPLADFSIGRSAIEPAMARVRMGFRSDLLFRNYQLDNPERLLRGRIDLAFFAVVIAPLLLIALGYGVFSGDRDRGTARLILAQAGGVRRLVVARSINRLALVIAPILLAAQALLSFGPDLPDRAGLAMLWLAVAIAGLLFWWAIILVVNTLRASAETSAFTLIAIWAVLVLVAPPLLSAAAQTLHPPPSRLAQIVEGREAELRSTEVNRNEHSTDGLVELQRVKDVVAEYQRITNGLERGIRPISEAFDTQLMRQQEVVSQTQFIAPPLTAANTLARIAGTDTQSYTALRRSARDYLYSYTAALDRGIANNRLFTLADYDALPVYEAPPRPTPSLAGLAWLIGLALIIGGWAFRRFGKVPVY